MRVLYIGGAGRSGSTLLEMILGNLPGFFSIGEARYFWEYLLREDVVCGCGARLSSCNFWSAVKTHLDSDGAVDFNRMAILSERLNRTRNAPWITANISLSFLREWGEIVSGTEALYHTIWQEASSEVLVDTSKVPSHLSLLRRVSGIDLRVLHLVRDGRAVAYSWSKRQKREPAIIDRKERMPRRSALRAMLTWAVENAYIAKTGHTMPYTIMRYEDFAQNPDSELGRALQELGFGNVDLGLLREPMISLSPTHSVGGNPIRFSTTGISIVSDNEWRDKMHVITKLSLGLVAVPILSRFRYRLWQ